MGCLDSEVLGQDLGGPDSEDSGWSPEDLAGSEDLAGILGFPGNPGISEISSIFEISSISEDLAGF